MIHYIMQFIAGGLIFLIFGSLLILFLGRLIVTMREKDVEDKIRAIKQEHNQSIKEMQAEYNENRRKFLKMLGKYRQNITKMKVKDV